MSVMVVIMGCRLLEAALVAGEIVYMIELTALTPMAPTPMRLSHNRTMRVSIVLVIATITINIKFMMNEIGSGMGIETTEVEVIRETEATIEVAAVEKVTETREEIE
jgi:hypothetical protein